MHSGYFVPMREFSAILAPVTSKVEWEVGININGENLNHLQFADDIVLISDRLEKAIRMLEIYVRSCSHC